jgi:hypothetical protein
MASPVGAGRTPTLFTGITRGDETMPDAKPALGDPREFFKELKERQSLLRQLGEWSRKPPSEYMLIEMWKPKKEWLKLSGEEQMERLSQIMGDIQTLKDEGLGFDGFILIVEDAGGGKPREDWRFVAVWKLSKEHLDKKQYRVESLTHAFEAVDEKQVLGGLVFGGDGASRAAREEAALLDDEAPDEAGGKRPKKGVLARFKSLSEEVETNTKDIAAIRGGVRQIMEKLELPPMG